MDLYAGYNIVGNELHALIGIYIELTLPLESQLIRYTGTSTKGMSR